MQKWVLFGIVAAFFLAVTNIWQKHATQGTSPSEMLIFSGLAMLVVGGAGMLITGEGFTMAELGAYKTSAIAGLLLACGSLAIGYGYANGANVAIFPAIFNTNTAIALVLGGVFLNEFAGHTTSEIVKQIIGVVLSLGGALLIII